MEWGVTSPLFDMTPKLTGRALPRGREIEEWLRGRSGEVESFVILDDNAKMAPYMGHLVLVNEHCGLTEADADRAIAILNETVAL